MSNRRQYPQAQQQQQQQQPGPPMQQPFQTAQNFQPPVSQGQFLQQQQPGSNYATSGVPQLGRPYGAAVQQQQQQPQQFQQQQPPPSQPFQGQPQFQQYGNQPSQVQPPGIQRMQQQQQQQQQPQQQPAPFQAQQFRQQQQQQQQQQPSPPQFQPQTPLQPTSQPFQGQPQFQQYGNPPSQMQPPGVQRMQQQQQPIDQFVPPSPDYQCPNTFLRMTVNACPNTPSLSSKVGIPFGCVINPLAQPEKGEEVPLITQTAADKTIVRCKKCRTYINPFITILEQNQKWRCNMCSTINDLPVSFQYNQQGQRVDPRLRPELSKGCVEFTAPSDYMVRPPMPPVYVFVIETSYASTSSGILESISSTLSSVLDNLPGGTRTKIGFITFDSSIHFYSLKSTQSMPKMLVVPEIAKFFLPQPDDLVVNLHDSKAVVKRLVESLPSMFRQTKTVDAVAGAALKAAFGLLRGTGGKLMLFTSTPTNVGPGSLKDRTQSKLLGTDKEVQLLKPQDDYYKFLGLDCSKQHITVDVFGFGGRYSDLATLGVMAQITSGQIYHYALAAPATGVQAGGPGNQQSLARHHLKKLEFDLWRNLVRETGWEAVMRVRVSKGLKILKHFGHGFVRNQDLLALPSVHTDQGFGVQIQVEESLTSSRTVSVQAALLYTSSSGERRIRVMTKSLGITTQIRTMFEQADCRASTVVLGQMAVARALTSKLGDAREAILNKCVEVLRVYRYDVAGNPQVPQGTVLIPPTLADFPRYCMAMIKHPALRYDSKIGLDQRIAAMMSLRCRPSNLFIPYVYPRFFRIDTLTAEVGKEGPDGNVVLPPSLELSSEHLTQNGVFLLDNADDIFIYVGNAVNPQVLSAIFGVSNVHEIDITQTQLPRLDNDLSKKVGNIISALRLKSERWQRTFVVREGGHAILSSVFTSMIIQDRSAALNASYHEFLREVQRLMNSK